MVLFEEMIALIPVVDDFIQAMLVAKLRFLKERPKLIEYIFQTSHPETISRLQQLLTSQQLRVVIGFPREQSTLPAYVITLAPEREQPSGLGDNLSIYSEDEIGEIGGDPEGIAQLFLDDYISSTFMNATYRIECWSDNGDLTAYMYAILKWCLWTSRLEMLQMGWNNIRVEGTDLEPVPDYMPVFVYRRAAQLILTYDNLYQENLEQMKLYLDIVTHPQNYSQDEDNNIIDLDGNIVIPAKHSFVLRTYVYNRYVQNGTTYDTPSVLYSTQTAEIPYNFPTLKNFPNIGKQNTLYLKLQVAPDGIEYYQVYFWNGKQYESGVQRLARYDEVFVINSEGSV